MESLKITMANMHEVFHSRMLAFESQLSKEPTSNPSGATAGITAEYASFKSFVVDMLNNLQQQLEALLDTVDSIEMRTRRKMLLLHGVSEEKNEDTPELTSDVIKTHLKISGFTVADIKRCQRLGRPGSLKPRPILFKLLDTGVRDKLWFSKTHLKGTGITISEFLTKTRHDIFMAAREKFGVTKCWTREGCIYVQRPDNTRYRIYTANDLHKYDADVTEIKSTTVSKTTSSKTRRAAAIKK